MKKLILSLGVASIIFAGCNDDDDDNTSSGNNNNAAIAQVVNTVRQGTWRITNFTDNSVDETSHFDGYVFTFDNNNVLTAEGQVNSYTGTWSVTDDSSNDDSPSGDIDFNIFFSAPPDFTDLNDDWDIQERTGNRIRLIDISGGNGGTDYLVFEKNPN